MLKLFRTEQKFFHIFNQMVVHIAEAAQILHKMVSEPTGDMPALAAQIKDLEHKGDELTHHVLVELNKTFITPIDREDIHDLASALDDILDMVEDIADRFVLYRVTAPTDIAVKLSDILYQSAVEVGATVALLGKPHPDVNECSVRVNSLENEADRVSRDAISLLFERETDPMSVIKWKEIYENFEAGTDRCEDVANILERIALKHH